MLMVAAVERFVQRRLYVAYKASRGIAQEAVVTNGNGFGDALIMELVVSHGVEGAARLLHEAADALLQNEGFGAAEQAAEAGMASILLLSTIH